MGLKAAVQALKKAEPLKDKVQRCKDLLNDNDAWVCQQQLQKIYQQVLILDLEYALDKKVEQELWNLGFKNYIVTLQSQAKDRKNPKRGESQALLSWCLEAASGFYLTLLQEICTAFDLDLPFRRKGYVYGCTSPWKAVEKLSTPHKSSCFYACQYCLVHLGDIARYRNESKQAELFYRHAVSLSPTSGQPYNQLALLETSRGDKLGTVFHYARSVTVKHPFPVATANLAKTLSSALNDQSYNIEGKTKLSAQEYVTVFLKLHGIIHNLGDLKIASSYVKLLTETLTALVATESFSSWMLVQMLVINLYALQHTTGITSDAAEFLKTDQLSTDEKLAKNCILDFISGSLAALLLPVYTIKNHIVEYFALPSIKLCLDWIRINPTVLEETAFTSRLQIWPSLCVLLNALQQSIVDFKYDQYIKVPLPEDRDLQGFLPLEKNFENLKFTNTDIVDDIATLNKLRAVRLIQLGHFLTQYQINGSPLIAIVMSDQAEANRFIPLSEGAGPSNELMKELEELSLSKEKPVVPASPVLSESASSKGSAEIDITENAQERRVGILKPQGSLERNRDSISNTTDTNIVELNSLPSTRKPRQNIAMQAIMRRAETEQKQVTFKNVSPVCIEEETDKVKTNSTASPIKPTGNKNIPITTEPTKVNTNTLSTVQNRLPLMPCATVAIQSQPTSNSNQLKSTKIQPAPQVNQVPSQEQSSDTLLQASCLSQFGQQSQTLGSLCYQSQSFNVQNPQFTKNFMSGHIANMPNYALQGQLNKTPPTIAQNLGVQHIMNQNRPLLQRMVQNVPQNSLLQQNVGISSTAQQSIMPNISQSMYVQQTANTGLQQNMNINRQQQNHNLGIQQPNIIPNNVRSNGISTQNQINMPVTSIASNISTIPTLNTYQKNLQVANITNIPNTSLSPNNITNYQLNFNQGIYTQNNFSHASQKQLSPTMYNKNTDIVDFPFSNQIGTPKNQQQSTSNYQVFQNFESADFGLWKDTQPPQPPVAWWGAARGTQMHKDSCTADTFQNWNNVPNSGNMNNRSLMSSNNYQHNSIPDRHFGTGSNFEDSRAYEVDQKPVQSTTTGNTYSLFSGNTWGSGSQISNPSSQDQMKTRLNQQSLWSGPGPSPLERLLEQQKSLREGGT
ncbi:protein SMG7-like isoform X1 [Polistes fuscatus]|uniref:protein SMG7-like isoform X1 n=1 Tax=Polistes fuscatus TaxID=30207 RepID=UPI001CA92919|nr:protein SMG7-like isoform X1 [Polistes fuscatus]XP_043504629.1 protein SMG7-like isoform X1 [Polistes fuscatus]XP_043504630.1 protein SMG7-like isoform X1 [Polistes fuscatus]